ncbi:MAG: squalene--hopene cyclase, partial [bacterium]|nr:squalene--hopene cyclase [bacterium]
MTTARGMPAALPWLASAAGTGDLEAEAADALARSVDALAGLQDPAGWWKGDLETNVAIESEDLLLRAFLGIDDAEVTALTANWIRSKQSPDGGWSNRYGGPSDLSLAVEAYAALRLAGDSPDAEHMRLAAEFVRDMGGVECARVFTRIWLALIGQWSWRDLPAIPPELILLPRWLPLNIYDFACWARQTIVPLSIVSTYRPQVDLGVTLDELRTGAVPPERVPRSMRTPAGCFQRLDRVLHKFHALAPWRLRETSMKLAEQWIIRRQESDGCWGGI